MEEKKHKIQTIKDIFQGSDFWDRNTRKYITKEFQEYGYRLALKLNDIERKSLYIKLAKEIDRPLLDRALSFAIDYPKANRKARVFMWKLKELKEERKRKKVEEEKKQ